MTDDERNKQDFYFFLDNMKRLHAKHGEKFAVIKNKKILGIYDTFGKARDKTLETEEYGTFLVQQCFDDEAKMTRQCFSNFKLIPAWPV